MTTPETMTAQDIPPSEELARLALTYPDGSTIRSELLTAASFACGRNGKMTEAADPTPIAAIYDRMIAACVRPMTADGYAMMHIAEALDCAEESVTRFGSQLPEDGAHLPSPAGQALPEAAE